MSIIERAVKRLEELNQAGVAVPWDAAGMADTALARRLADEAPAADGPSPSPVSTIERAVNSPVHEVVPRIARRAPRQPREPQHVSLDLQALQRTGELVEVDSRSVQAQQFRVLKQPLLRNARGGSADDRMSLVMVTSAVSGEGKTFCSINLAMSLAMEVDISVLLVDADVVHPGVLARLGVSPHKGLLDVLTERDVELDDAVLRTNVPKLSILPAGTANRRSTELLASDALNQLLARLSEQCRDRVVIFDAPPLLLTTEAKVLATRVGQVVMVVEAGRTPRELSQRAFACLEPCPVVMSILNKGREPPESRAYGDYYG